ncbi:MAG: hypothetical protein LBD03_08455, partial [Methanobrevibacter sp.]|nr:hypothetical protein [Candidatus Methanovirga procula]
GFSVILKAVKETLQLQIRRTKKDIRRIILNIIVDEVFTDSIKIRFVLDIIQISDLDGKQNLMILL